MILAYTGAGLAVLLGTMALRALPRLVHDRRVLREAFPLAGDQGDAMSHMIMTDLVRRNGHRIPARAPQYLLGERLDYPLFFHFVMSFVPRHTLERWEWVVTPFIEGVHAALLFGLTVYLLQHFSMPDSAIWWALAAIFGYVATPLLTRPWRRTGFFGERSFGYMFGHLYVAALVAFVLTGAWPFIAAAAIAFAIAAASAKFASQAMVFLSVSLAALLWDVSPLLVLSVAAAFSLAVSRGYVWMLLRAHIRHSVLYCRHLVHLADGTKAFSSQDLWTAAAALSRGRIRESLAAFRRHPLSRLLTLLPWLMPFVLLTAATWQSGATSQDDLVNVVLAWGWSSVIVALLTMTDTLKFLGEGERYLEYGVLPMVLAPVFLPPELGGPWWFLLTAYCARVYVRHLRNRAALSLPSESAAGLAAFMARQPPATLYGVPGRIVLPLCYGTEHRAIWNIAHIDSGARQETWLSLFSDGAVYPFSHPDAARNSGHRYGADLVVIWKGGAKAAAQAWGLRYDMSGHAVVFENDDFAIYRAVSDVKAASEEDYGAQRAANG